MKNKSSHQHYTIAKKNKRKKSKQQGKSPSDP